jgi:3-hydroxyisobutyrate dehydrogenase-like beta-hydroxyacid dehydrogenase
MKQISDLRAGVIGLGHIGGGVAVSLLNSGRVPVVYDIVPDAYKRLKGMPEQVGTLAEVAAQSDIIMVAVINYGQCWDVIAGEGGILENAHDGMVITTLSTISVDECKELARLCEEKGVDYLDIGVTLGSRAYTNGLVAMCGGSKTVFDYASPVLADWSSSHILCGPVGAGMACKIARNLNTYGLWAVVNESYTLVTSAGVDGEKFLEVIAAADKLESLTYMWNIARSNDENNEMPPLQEHVYTLMVKDLEAAKALSNSLGLESPYTDELMRSGRSIFGELI